MRVAILAVGALVVPCISPVPAWAEDDIDEGIGKARALLKKGDAAEARKVLEPLATASPKSAEVQYLLAQAAILERAFPRAQKHLEKTVELDPAKLDARVVLAALLRKGGKAREAASQLQEALKRDKKHLAALQAMGELEHDAKRYEKAAEWYTKALAERKDDAALSARVAAEWTESVKVLRDSPGKKRDEQADRALAALKRLAELRPDLDSVLFNMGTVEFLAGRWDAAARDLKLFLEKKPDDGPGAFNLSMALEQGGHLKEAIGAWKRFIEIAKETGGELQKDIPKANERIKACEKEARARAGDQVKKGQKKTGGSTVPKAGL